MFSLGIYRYIAVLLPLSSLTASVLADAPVPTYERDIRPILTKRCTVCHNPSEVDDLETSGGLALDSFDSILKGTPKAKVVAPGKAATSALFTRLIESDDEKRMPLGDVPLSKAQQDTIRRWIDAGSPRGELVGVAAKPAAKSARRIRRTLDLSIGFSASPPRTGRIESRIKIGPLPGVSALAYTPDGTMLAVGTYGQVTLWDVEHRKAARFLTGDFGPVQALAFSPDGTRLALGSGLPARSGLIRLIRVADGSTLQDLEGHKDVVSGLAFRADGLQLASTSFDTTVRFWDLKSGKSAGVFTGHSDFTYDVTYLTDGKSVITCSKDRTVKRIDASKFTEVHTYAEHNDDVLALAIRPDGSGFVTSGNEPAIRCWTFKADKSTKRINGNGGPVHQLAFSRDGKTLVSAGGDKSIRVFDGVKETLLKSLAGPTDWQYAVAISPDGRKVAGGGWDGIVRVWDVTSANLDLVLLQPPSTDLTRPDWLAIATTGALFGTDDLKNAVRWVINGKESSSLPPLKVPAFKLK